MNDPLAGPPDPRNSGWILGRSYPKVAADEDHVDHVSLMSLMVVVSLVNQGPGAESSHCLTWGN